MKAILVGQNPTRLNAPAFTGTRSGKRLNAWINYLDITDAILINATSKVGRVKLSDAEHVVVLGAILKHAPCKVVALGKYASQVLRVLQVNHFTLPHPSGMNRKLNDKQFVNDQLLLCKAWLLDSDHEVSYHVT